MKKVEDGEDGGVTEAMIDASETSSGEEKDQPNVELETHQEILHLIAWGAWLSKSVLCCKRIFEDLMERLVQTGPFFASLAKEDQDLVKEVGTNLEGVAASLRPLMELIDLCRESSLQLHLLLQHEEILKRTALLGGTVGSKIEDLINELISKGVNLEQKALKRAINAAYQLQHVLYAIDDTDRDAYDEIRPLVQKRQPNSDFNGSASEVSYINGEPLELLSEMLVRRASGGTVADHRYFQENAELKSICEKVVRGDIDVSDEELPEGNIEAPRKARASVSGVWTRPQTLTIDGTIDSAKSSPRVLWEVDTPTEFRSDKEFLESFRVDVERSFTESAAKGSKGKGDVEMFPDTDSSKFQDPPPPEIQDVSEGNLEPLPHSRATRRISFIPGQEGGERRESYLEGIESPVHKCRRQSRRSYLAAGEDAPWEYLCPITRELMVDPVTLSTGQTYERAQISRWINNGHYTCPVTGLQITNTELVPNYALRHAIGRWADDHNIKLPEPEPVQIQAQNNVTSLQRLSAWGQSVPDATCPVVTAVDRLYRGNCREQEIALKEICEFAKVGGEAIRCNVAEVGAIPALIYQMQNGTFLARELAAKCLRFLSRSTNVMITQAASSAIPFLVKLLRKGTPHASEAAAGALVNLSAKNEVNKLCIAAAGAIPILIGMLNGTALLSITQEVSAAALCNLAVNKQNRIEISKEAIPKLIQVVSNCLTPEAGEYAAHVLGSLSCNNFQNANLMIEAGAAPVLVAMAGPGTPWTQEAAARAIRNISFYKSLRPALVEAGAIQQLKALLEYSTPRAADAAATALRNLTETGPIHLEDHLPENEQKQHKKQHSEEKQ